MLHHLPKFSYILVCELSLCWNSFKDGLKINVIQNVVKVLSYNRIYHEDTFVLNCEATLPCIFEFSQMQTEPYLHIIIECSVIAWNIPQLINVNMAKRIIEIITIQSSPLRLRLSIITLHLIKLERYSNLLKLCLEGFFSFFVKDKFNYL